MGAWGWQPPNIGNQKTLLITSSCCRFRPYFGHVDSPNQGQISRITFKFCIIQSDDRISINIVKKTMQQFVVTIHFNSTAVSLESCFRQNEFVPLLFLFRSLRSFAPRCMQEAFAVVRNGTCIYQCLYYKAF